MGQTGMAFGLRSIGFRLTLAVNAVMLTGVAGFLAFDYWRETGQRVATRRYSLSEEAATVHQAVVRLAEDSAVQEFVDGVCRVMSDDQSPGHHIVVEAAGQVIQSRAHGRDGPAAYAAVRADADGGTGRWSSAPTAAAGWQCTWPRRRHPSAARSAGKWSCGRRGWWRSVPPWR